MTHERFKRKLGGILNADTVGYSLLMKDNEAATVQTLTAYRKTITSEIQ